MLTIPIGWWSLALVVAIPRQPSPARISDSGASVGRGRRRALG